MRRNFLGSWGAELDDSEYACALAALGILEARATQQYPHAGTPEDVADAILKETWRGTVTCGWRGAQHIGTDPETIYSDANLLAEGWREVLMRAEHRAMPSISIDPLKFRDTSDADALMEALMSVWGIQGLVLRSRTIGRERTTWHWPVSIGILGGPSREPLSQLFEEEYDGDWLPRLGVEVRIGRAHDACDILLLTRDEVEELLKPPRPRVRASFIVVFDDPIAASKAAGSSYDALAQRVGAAGIALVGAQADYRKGWYREFIRNLSHDLPVHAAVRTPTSAPAPTIIGVPRALDRLRIAAVAQRIDRAAAASGAEPFLEAFVANRAMISEGDDGVPVAEAFKKEAQAVAGTAPPRRIQAAWADPHLVPPFAWEHYRPVPDDETFLSIHVGPSTDGLRTDVAFPSEGIDYRSGAVKIGVSLALEGGVVHGFNERTGWQREVPAKKAGEADEGDTVSTAHGEIALPAAGASTAAHFVVQGDGSSKGRITLSHGNRIVQTARINIGVMPASRDIGEGERTLEVVPEAPIVPSLDDLDERRQFDLAIIADDQLGGRLRLDATADGDDTPVLLDDLAGPIKVLRKAVGAAAYRLGDTLTLDEEKMRGVMLSLANNGRLLYDHLKKKLGHRVDDVERVQIVSRGTAFFPIEFVYSGPRPRDTKVSVCEQAASGLLTGDCTGCPNHQSVDRTCPLHFWGFSKLIERHGTPPDLRRAPGGGSRRAPLPTRTSFGRVASVAYAASTRAYDYGPKGNAKKAEDALHDALVALASRVNRAETWPGWLDIIRKHNPNLLVLLPHAALIPPADDEVLRIGTEDDLAKGSIDAPYIGGLEAPQLLLLLGCAVADVSAQFAPYPELFRDHGADIVVAPIAPIRGADAVPIAIRIAELLRGAQDGPEIVFGDLLRGVRQRLLAEGHPGVLGVVAFGDADWIFGNAAP
ncbi:hypothetical protein [Mesorhizobium sp. WSM4310]|uniref:hypothetical protein n=1 Tax=Mesorhizobium sp. WSM4310 TaxID=2589883 RepID=UPI00163D5580|nr:hypothetical protein [Mesorhizobium sp. WSM4310]